MAVSAVVGTILMIAATVVLGATVYAALNGFGGKAVKDSPNAAFKVQSIDTDGNGRSDNLKVTYLTGPSDVQNADVKIAVQNATGVAVSQVAAKTDNWNPGDFVVYNPSAGGSYFVTVSILGTTVVDQTATIDE